MKNLIKTTLLLLALIFSSACTTTNIDPSKPDINVKNNYSVAKKLFNERN